LPDGFAVAEASFERSGEDLLLTAPDGTNVVINDFFAHSPPPSLATPDGAQVSHAMAGLLAGPSPIDRLAAAGTDAEAIGTVNTISGGAFVIRVDGTREELAIDTPLYAGDILETGVGGAVGVVLADETTFAMAGDGRMVLDEMIYDPGTQEGSLSLVVLKGVYTFVSGMVSKTDPDAMSIETPVGTIGIRGTQIGIDFADGKTLSVVMMREADGYVGEVHIRNEGGVQVMNEANQVLFTSAYGLEPGFLASMEDADIVAMFEAALVHLPMTTGRANDYTTQAPQGGGELEEFNTEAGPTVAEEAPTSDEVIRVTGEDYAPAPVPVAPVEPLEPVAQEPETPPADERRIEDTPVTIEPFASAGIVVDLNAEPVADDQAVATSEDQPIDDRLTAADDDEDTLSYALADGGAPGHGSVIIHADGTYTYTPTADFSGSDSFAYTVSDGQGGTATATVSVSVADVPVVTVAAASGPEDTAIALTISADVPGSESLASLTISGVPEGAVLSAGTDNGDGSWTLSGGDLDDLAALTLTPPAHSSRDLSLSVTATSTDGGVASASFVVAVAAVADAPTLQVFDTVYGESGEGSEGGEGGEGGKIKGTGGDDVLYGTDGDDVITGKGGADILYGYGAGGDEGGLAVVPLAIETSLTDTDKSETLGVAITGVPDGATLSAGTDLGSGLWTLTPEELEGLAMTLPEDYRGDFQLAVAATTTDVDVDTAKTDQAIASATISVAYQGGDGGGDLLKGGGGDDVLYGGGGDDVLKGDGGDVLYGGAGDDELKGGGDDVLHGGAGDDVLKGGGGKDVFVFDSQAGRDIIEDFREGEVLRFEGVEFSPENLSVSQNGDNVSIIFEDQAVEVTINDVNLNEQSYSVTRNGDAVLITFDSEN
jgi:Ca2+-binding RTX toxin-like protein